jgi:hypothetical protein
MAVWKWFIISYHIGKYLLPELYESNGQLQLNLRANWQMDCFPAAIPRTLFPCELL